MSIAIHPPSTAASRTGPATICRAARCGCLASRGAVKVKVGADLHNHACGCTQCWKPDGALFSVIGVVPRDKVTVTAQRREARGGR